MFLLHTNAAIHRTEATLLQGSLKHDALCISNTDCPQSLFKIVGIGNVSTSLES